jgi:serine-type D-Ala-D-Ala carboxypeptidase (penicillin-binding protein 5/6)
MRTSSYTLTALLAPRGRMMRALLGLALCIALLSPAATACAATPAAARPLGSFVSAGVPEVSAPAGILVTPDGHVLWSRNADERRAMASTTKMMTAVVVLEHAKLTDVVTVPKSAAAVAQSAVNLTPGESLTVEQLLQIMLVESANDAAYTLADHVGGSVDGFVGMMNEKAAALGLKNTHYLNPHGLDVPGHYSSAADLVALARYAMRDPLFRQTVSMTSVMVPGPHGERRVFKTTDELLGSYPGMEGIKTGWTNDAGYCLVSAARRGPAELYGVILGTRSESARFVQSRRLLDWGFKHYRTVRVVDPVEKVGTIPVSDWLDKDIVATVAETTSTLLFDLAGPVKHRYALRPAVTAPVKAGSVVGVVTAYQGESILATAPIVAAADMAGPGLWDRMRVWWVRSWRGVFGPRDVRTAIVTVKD